MFAAGAIPTSVRGDGSAFLLGIVYYAGIRDADQELQIRLLVDVNVGVDSMLTWMWMWMWMSALQRGPAGELGTSRAHLHKEYIRSTYTQYRSRLAPPRPSAHPIRYLGICRLDPGRVSSRFEM